MLTLIEKERYEADAAWRSAVQMWLQDHGLITVTDRNKVLPCYPDNRRVIRGPAHVCGLRPRKDKEPEA